MGVAKRRKRPKGIYVLKRGAKVKQWLGNKKSWEWEIDRTNKDSVILKTLWQGTGVSDDECLICYREVPKDNLCVACGTIIPEGSQVCPNCLDGR
jgi:hypothetical protein